MQKHILTILIILLGTTACNAQLTMYLESQIPIGTDKITALQISSDGRFLAIGTEEGVIYIRDIGANRQLQRLEFHKEKINALLFDSKSQYLVSGSDDKKIVVWDLYSGVIKQEIANFGDKVRSLALGPDDRLLAAAGDKKSIYLLEFPLGIKRGELKGHEKDVLFISFNRGGDQLLSVGEDEQMIIWNISELRQIRRTEIDARTLPNSGNDVTAAAVSADRHFVALGIEERVLAKGGKNMIFRHNLAFYEWNSGSRIKIIEGNERKINFLAITPDKRSIITDNSTLRTNQLAVWNIEKGIIESNYTVPGSVSGIDCSIDGKWLTAGIQSGDHQCQASLWQLSGVTGYASFSDESLPSSKPSSFGGTIRITTPSEPLIQMGETRTIAIMYFENAGISADNAKIATTLLESKLINSPLIRLVERNQVDKAIDELKYQMSGLTKTQAAEIGRHIGAGYVIIGNVSKLGSMLIITAKLVNVETSEIEGTREVQCSNASIENIVDMVSALAPAIAKF